MAQVQLTDRQKDIKARLDKGETPERVGKALKITTNAVYQQIRRMRKAGVKVGGTTQTGSSGRSSGNRRSSGSKGKAAKATTTRRQSARTRPVAAATPQTAEELLRSEIADLKARAEVEAGRIVEAEGVIVEAKTAIEGIEAEAAKREDVLAVLTGDKVAHAKPAPKPADAPKGKGGKRGSGKPAPAAQEAAPAAQDGTSEAPAAEEAPAPADAPQEAAAEAAPSNGGSSADTPEPSTQSEREATGDFDPFATGEAAEADAAQAAAEEPQTA